MGIIFGQYSFGYVTHLLKFKNSMAFNKLLFSNWVHKEEKKSNSKVYFKKNKKKDDSKVLLFLCNNALDPTKHWEGYFW